MSIQYNTKSVTMVRTDLISGSTMHNIYLISMLHLTLQAIIVLSYCTRLEIFSCSQEVCGKHTHTCFNLKTTSTFMTKKNHGWSWISFSTFETIYSNSLNSMQSSWSIDNCNSAWHLSLGYKIHQHTITDIIKT